MNYTVIGMNAHLAKIHTLEVGTTTAQIVGVSLSGLAINANYRIYATFIAQKNNFNQTVRPPVTARNKMSLAPKCICGNSISGYCTGNVDNCVNRKLFTSEPEIVIPPKNFDLLKLLISRRKYLKLSAEDVAKYLNVTRQSIINIETGRHGLKYETIYKLCCLYRMKPNDFFPEISHVKIEHECEEIIVKRKKKITKISGNGLD